MDQITQITDHQEIAFQRLPDRFRDLEQLYPAFWRAGLCTGWEGLLFSLVEPAQQLEDIMFDMLAAMDLSNAAGVQLDRIGQIVGQPRNGLVDADYLVQIQAQISENNSDGTANNLMTISTLVLGVDALSVLIKEVFPAKAVIGVGTDTTPDNIARLVEPLQGAKVAGVGLDIEIFVDDNYFAFDSDSGAGSAGFATTANPEDGGNYTTIIT